MNTFPYSISIDRELSDSERAILRKLISETQPKREKEIDSLHVYGRCGCGSCPTVMFTPDIKREKERSILADFQGGDEKSGLIGILLWESNGRIDELEAWSIDGHDVKSWPDIESIKPIEITRE